MGWHLVLLSFVLIFPVELPDKTFVAALVLVDPLPAAGGVDRCRPRVLRPVRRRGHCRISSSRCSRSQIVEALSTTMFLIGAIMLVRAGPHADGRRAGAGGGVRARKAQPCDRRAGGLCVVPPDLRRRVGRPVADPDAQPVAKYGQSALGLRRLLAGAACGVGPRRRLRARAAALLRLSVLHYCRRPPSASASRSPVWSRSSPADAPTVTGLRVLVARLRHDCCSRRRQRGRPAADGDAAPARARAHNG